MNALCWLVFLALLSAFQFTPCYSQMATNQEDESESTVVFLVRHAEKTSEKQDPGLTTDGKMRAMELARLLRSSGIEYVHSSDYIRTKETANPAAAILGLNTELYNPRDLEALAMNMKVKGGKHLVVGHSNTTPSLVAILGGDPHTPINEAAEYDRLYIVTINDDCGVNTILMRYGKAYEESTGH
ncbi:MAG: histidine phosphatase family protein [Saprospiraceae bacterium]|nr:histidine phosphatase family protein [Saprospiraceae bacterium]